MKILDAYCGVGPWAQRDPILPYTPAQILGLLDECGVAEALVFSNLAHSWSSAPDINRTTAELCAAEPRFRPAFVLAPHPYDHLPQPADYAAAMRATGARAAWLRPDRQQHGVAPWLLSGLLEMCVQGRIPLFLPADAVTPEQIDELCRACPRLRLVLANLGYRVDVWLYPLLHRHPELRVCLGHTYTPPMGTERFVHHFGAERLIFGSGLPFAPPGGLIAHVMYARIPDAAKALILGGNLDALLAEARP